MLLPELEARDQRPCLIVGTSAGALISGALTATAHLGATAQAANLADLLTQVTKQRVIRPLWRQVPEVAVRYALHRNVAELNQLSMDVFRANHGSLRRTLGDPDLQVVHRLLGSDSPLQGELLSYLLFDQDFFDAAYDLGRPDARQWSASAHCRGSAPGSGGTTGGRGRGRSGVRAPKPGSKICSAYGW